MCYCITRMSKALTLSIEARLERETGTLFKEVPESIAWVYPSPYHVGMSSLGYQSLYRTINQTEGRAAHRAFLPDNLHASDAAPLLTYEGKRPVGDYPLAAFSVAYETEIAGVIQCLELSGIPPLAEDRDDSHPFILAGGPLTFSNPLPLAPFVDAIVMGEADDSLHGILDVFFDSRDRAMTLDRLAKDFPHVFIPSLGSDEMPPVDKCSDENLPACSQIVTPDTELRDMFLVEPERGCHRGCTYCVMRRSTNGGMRLVQKEKLLSLIPGHARRVGLVGAATTDHPQIVEIVEAISQGGREVGLSSLRVDRLNDRFVEVLKKAGNRSLTTASDGASQRLRDQIQRRSREDVLVNVAELARKHKMKHLKIYMMVGLPGETDDDIDELIEFSTRLSKRIPLSLGIAPFVAKRNTPLDGESFAGMATVERRLKRLRRGVKGRVDIRSTSARWAWVEYVLAQGGRAEGRAVLDAVHAGGKFNAWKTAFNALPGDRPQRAYVRPGNKLGRVNSLKVVR